MFLTYYIICVIYCFWRLSKTWNKNAMPGGLGITPGLDSIVVLTMAWILAPVDVSITWIKKIKEAEEARRNQSKL